MIIACYPKEKEKTADRTKIFSASDDVVKEQVVKVMMNRAQNLQQ